MITLNRSNIFFPPYKIIFTFNLKYRLRTNSKDIFWSISACLITPSHPSFIFCILTTVPTLFSDSIFHALEKWQIAVWPELLHFAEILGKCQNLRSSVVISIALRLFSITCAKTKPSFVTSVGDILLLSIKFCSRTFKIFKLSSLWNWERTS